MVDASAGHHTMHTHLIGSDEPDAPIVVALHGLTGHGKRWEFLANDDLHGVRMIAPDLIGHGFSSWEPPWAISDQVAALSAMLDEHVPAGRRAVVVAHSYGGAVAIRLAHARPDVVAGLVLLDPAQGLDPGTAREYAESSLAHWGYPDAEAAAAAKRMEGWENVPPHILDAEIAEHLVPTASGMVWRVSAPGAAVAWSEMARPYMLPPAGLPTHVVVADRVQPAFVRSDFLAACASERGDSVTVHHVDTEHMVPFLAPDLAARLVRDLIVRI
ncbi:alpha/beta fold hydrolase [Gordonia sp. PDNC005]|uniref:alpha/beta fold hydrolase n=1 Tax=unclassified Gordonia (in: high G+C Gram-positive bacteria) TaxID=2657482 RepID=UPI0019646391|nr:alpha/beta hydrolase [Gordonia sp. PDNC005]QRY61400.1 alpha/beta fold hydrolase [Gordonia sp. PDNC005]